MPLLSPGTKLKLLWYTLFSAIGVFHAEVLSWSSPDVLYNPANTLLVTPVYAVHYVLFGDLLLRHRRRDFRAVYLLGCLTGMYETFITKVYWSPPWNPEAFSVLGVAWIELLWIGFTWHAFMSFLIPFRIMSGLFAPGGTEPLAAKNLRAVLWLAPVVGATVGLGFGLGVEVMLPSVLLSLLVIALLAVLFMAGARRWGFTSPDQLVFGRTGRRTAWAAFATVYVAYGVLLRPEFFPLGLPLVPVLLVYGGLILLIRSVLASGETLPRLESTALPRPKPTLGYLGLYGLAFVGIFLAFAGIHSLVPWLFPVAAGLSVYVGAALPAVLLAILLVQTRTSNRGARGSGLDASTD